MELTETIINSLRNNQQVFKHLLSNKTLEEYTWKQDENKWSLLEIICHLVDEEVEDFRTRVQYTLERPGETPPPIDPVGWITSRQYAEQDYEQKLEAFLNERLHSIEYLQSLENPAWEGSYEHPTLGTLTAEMFFTNWLAHDFHHIRQINVLNYDYLKAKSGVVLTYAGKW